MVFARLTQFIADVHLNPDSYTLPGTSTAERLTNGLAKIVIVALLAGALMGVAQWGLGSHNNNVGAAASGKKKAGVCVGGVFVVGALAAIINFALAAGGTVQK